MRVALDTSPIFPGHTGIGRYVSELARALRRADGVELITGRAYDLCRGAPHHLRGAGGYSRRVRALFGGFMALIEELSIERFRLPASLQSRDVEVYHATCSRPPARPVSVPLVVTVHDLAPFELPDAQGRRHGATLRAHVAQTAEAATRIVLPSESALRQLSNLFPAAAARARAIYHGIGESFFSLSRSRPSDPSFVSVATLERRKNLITLIEAFAVVVARHPQARLRLIGQPQNDSAQVRKLLERLGIRTVVTLEGYLSDEEVARAYAGATGVAYLSLTEGFGFPVLEAMAAGAPVITSDRGAMREVAGEAALLVDPLDVRAVREAMLALIETPALGAELEEKGRGRAASFTWERCARQHVDVYGEAIAEFALHRR